MHTTQSLLCFLLRLLLHYHFAHVLRHPRGGAPVEYCALPEKKQNKPDTRSRTSLAPFTRKLPAFWQLSPTWLSLNFCEWKRESRRRQSFTFLRLLPSPSWLVAVVTASIPPLARRKTTFSVTCFALAVLDRTTFGHRLFLSHLSNDKLHLFLLLLRLVLSACHISSNSKLRFGAARERARSPVSGVMFALSHSDTHAFLCVIGVAKMLV